MMTWSDLPIPPLNLTDKEIKERSEQFSKNLVQLWERIDHLNDQEQTIVALPSLTLELDFNGDELSAYEERFMFLFLLLRQPLAKMIFITSRSIPEEIIDYYLSLLPGMVHYQVRRRLFLIATGDCSSTPLSIKVLQRPRLLKKIKSMITNPKTCHIVPFITTEYEREISLKLGVPMYGADPEVSALGLKSATRKIFREVGVSFPLGVEDVYDMQGIKAGLKTIIKEKSDCKKVLVKLNDSVSGLGIACVDLSKKKITGENEDQVLNEAIREMTYEAVGENYDSFMEKLSSQGGVVEEFIEGEKKESPSVQLRITPLGKLEVLSTHDQILGGEGGTFQGCRFPADKEYGKIITEDAIKIGNDLIGKGVLGRFAIDFVVTKDQGECWRSHAIEINIRKGGTTHPYLTLQYLTEGNYDASEVRFFTPCGGERYFVANDCVQRTDFRRFTPCDLFEIIASHNLQYNPSKQTGVILHMLSAISTYGRVGICAIGESKDAAQKLYDRTIEVLEEEATKFSMM